MEFLVKVIPDLCHVKTNNRGKKGYNAIWGLLGTPQFTRTKNPIW